MANNFENEYRTNLINKIMAFLTAEGEDCGLIKSNVFNLPCVVNSEERWATVTVTLGKAPKDDDTYADSGYTDRDFYQAHLKEVEEKAKVAAKKKEEKIARDKAERERKKAQKEALIASQKDKCVEGD